MRAKTLITLVLLLVVLGGFFYWQHVRAAAKKQPPKARAVTVEFANARVGDAPIEISAIGQILSSHSVAIRPQVSGTLLKVYFNEGDAVKQGDKLFEIDSAPYRAALAQAQAQVSSARAGILAAETQEKRLAPLADRGYVTPQELLDAKAAAEQARAGVQVAQAAVAAAQVNVNQSILRAPISGRTGSLSIKAGNLVTANETTALVTINQLQPVQAEFSVPQSQLAAIQAAQAKSPIDIGVHAQSGGPLLAEGKVLFIDNSVDQTTGTVKLKAEFANPNEALWPGTFVSFTATLAIEPNRVLVPELAVQPGADGSFVYTVGADNKAVLTPVKVDRQIGHEVVIAEGLKGGEKLIARAPRDLKPGAVVQAVADKSKDKPEGGAESTPKASAP